MESSVFDSTFLFIEYAEEIGDENTLLANTLGNSDCFNFLYLISTHLFDVLIVMFISGMIGSNTADLLILYVIYSTFCSGLLFSVNSVV